MAPRLAPSRRSAERRLAVMDMGSNTFRLVVFRYRPGGSFQLVDEVRHAVRLSGGAGPKGLHPDALERAGHAANLYRAFCASAGVDDVVAVTTSAVRDAENRDQALAALSVDGELEVRVLSAREEAWYGYLGAVNSTTLVDGHVLDLGGGSVQVSQVAGRELGEVVSRPLGAVRMTERFLSAERSERSDIRALRRHVNEELDGLDWLTDAQGRMVAIGGTVRTLASMHQRAVGYPLLGELHGYRLPRAGLDDLVDTMLALPASERSRIPGLKQDRADITLAGAVVIGAVLERAGVEHVEICSQGLREGIFYERFLSPTKPPLIPDIRRQSVMNLVDTYRCDLPHVEHVCTLALQMYDELSRLGVQTPLESEREMLWAAGMLHDAGVLVDYNDHHKHGYYLVLNAGLPGYSHRELAMVALLVRAHRKGQPSISPLEEILRKAKERDRNSVEDPSDEGALRRLACCLRIAEQLERGRARGIRGLRVEATKNALRLRVTAVGDPSVALWSAGLESPIAQRAFGRRLELSVDE